ncbi:MAG: CheY-like chemotaxis protein [Planctomycetota bacterium]|jgi:CheY-like chemotaxis protein
MRDAVAAAVLMTGNGSNLTDQNLECAGIDAVLDKPLTKPMLLDVIAGVLAA